MIVVSDTSPISNLLQINALYILRELFTEVLIPSVVHHEVLALENFNEDLTDYKNALWVKVMTPSDNQLVELLSADLDAGEAAAIALSIELKVSLLLIDERLGTKVAKEKGLQTIGLLGILVQAKRRNVIEEVKPVIEALKANGFWITNRLQMHILDLVGEY